MLERVITEGAGGGFFVSLPQVMANYLIKYLIAVSRRSNEGAARPCCSSPRAAVPRSAKKPNIRPHPPTPSSRSALPGQRRGGCRRSLRLCRPRSASLASLWDGPPCSLGAPAGTGGSGSRGGRRGAAPRHRNAGSRARWGRAAPRTPGSTPCGAEQLPALGKSPAQARGPQSG